MTTAISLTPKGKCRVWKHKDSQERVEACRAMLAIHGFLSEAENEKVKKRIRKWARYGEQP